MRRPPGRLRSLRRTAAAGGLAAALASAAGRASATELCEVRVVGEGAAAWHDAARAIPVAPGDTDCAEVLVEVASGGARLTFKTRDQRRAERDLGGPDELAPTLAALRVAVPAADLEPPRDRAPAAAVGAKARPGAVRPPGPAHPEADHPAAQVPGPGATTGAPVTVGAQLGFRGGVDDLVSPTIDALAAVDLGGWELGVLGRYEVRYAHFSAGDPPQPKSSGVGVGIIAGVRQPLGEAVALLSGGTLSLAALDEQAALDQGRAELRIGAYAGAALPRRSSTRLRCMLGIEAVPHALGSSTANAAGVPIFPWLAFTVGLGVELGAPG